MVSLGEVDSKALSMAILMHSKVCEPNSMWQYFYEKWQNGECNVRNFRRFFFGMSSDVPEFKIHDFASDFEF